MMGLLKQIFKVSLCIGRLKARDVHAHKEQVCKENCGFV